MREILSHVIDRGSEQWPMKDHESSFYNVCPRATALASINIYLLLFSKSFQLSIYHPL